MSPFKQWKAGDFFNLLIKSSSLIDRYMIGINNMKLTYFLFWNPKEI